MSGNGDFDPSREAWADFEPAEIVRRVRCLADDAPDEGDSPAQVWRHACDTIFLRMGAFEPRARDERWDGRDDASRLGAEPASPVAESEAPDPEVQGISLTQQICFDKLKRERDAYREALKPFCDAMARKDTAQSVKLAALEKAADRARTLLSQSSEGGEPK